MHHNRLANMGADIQTSMCSRGARCARHSTSTWGEHPCVPRAATPSARVCKQLKDSIVNIARATCYASASLCGGAPVNIRTQSDLCASALMKHERRRHPDAATCESLIDTAFATIGEFHNLRTPKVQSQTHGQQHHPNRSRCARKLVACATERAWP